MKLIALDAPPPRPRYRASVLGEAEARKAIQLLAEGKACVTDGCKLPSRPAAAGRAKRLRDNMRKLDPAGDYRTRTWKEDGRFRWAVEGTPAQGDDDGT